MPRAAIIVVIRVIKWQEHVNIFILRGVFFASSWSHELSFWSDEITGCHDLTIAKLALLGIESTILVLLAILSNPMGLSRLLRKQSRFEVPNSLP